MTQIHTLSSIRAWHGYRDYITLHYTTLHHITVHYTAILISYVYVYIYICTYIYLSIYLFTHAIKCTERERETHSLIVIVAWYLAVFGWVLCAISLSRCVRSWSLEATDRSSGLLGHITSYQWRGRFDVVPSTGFPIFSYALKSHMIQVYTCQSGLERWRHCFVADGSAAEHIAKEPLACCSLASDASESGLLQPIVDDGL